MVSEQPSTFAGQSPIAVLEKSALEEAASLESARHESTPWSLLCWRRYVTATSLLSVACLLPPWRVFKSSVGEDACAISLLHCNWLKSSLRTPLHWCRSTSHYPPAGLLSGHHFIGVGLPAITHLLVFSQDTTSLVSVYQPLPTCWSSLRRGGEHHIVGVSQPLTHWLKSSLREETDTTSVSHYLTPCLTTSFLVATGASKLALCGLLGRRQPLYFSQHWITCLLLRRRQMAPVCVSVTCWPIGVSHLRYQWPVWFSHLIPGCSLLSVKWLANSLVSASHGLAGCSLLSEVTCQFTGVGCRLTHWPHPSLGKEMATISLSMSALKLI